MFALGSALCGSAQNMTWLIAARGKTPFPNASSLYHDERFLVVQGVGAGGLQSVPNIIIADLVPLAERGSFQGLVGVYAS